MKTDKAETASAVRNLRHLPMAEPEWEEALRLLVDVFPDSHALRSALYVELRIRCKDASQADDFAVALYETLSACPQISYEDTWGMLRVYYSETLRDEFIESIGKWPKSRDLIKSCAEKLFNETVNAYLACLFLLVCDTVSRGADNIVASRGA